MLNAKRPIVFAAFTLAIALAAGHWYATRPSPPPLDQPTRARPAIASVSLQPGDIEVQQPQWDPVASSPSRSNPGHVDPVAAEVLPSEDIPFPEQVADLAALALKGHPTAACRLFVGVSRCAFHTARRNFSQRMEASLGNRPEHGDDELFIRAISRSQGNAADISGCDGIDTGSAPKADDYLAQAVARMSPRQKVLLAMMRADGTVVRLPRQPDTEIRPGRSSDYLVPQFLADNSLRFLQEGVAASDPLALEGLILVHAPGFLPGASNGMSIAIPDPRKFAHHALLMQAVYGPETLGPFVEEMLGQTLASMAPNMLRQVEASVAASAAAWNLNIAEPLTLDGPAVGDAEPMCTAR